MSERETLGSGLGGSVEPGKQSPARKVALALLLIVVSAAVIFSAVGLGRVAIITPEIPWVFRGLMLTAAALLFGVWFWVAWTLANRKVTRGRFMLGLEEARRRREEQLSRLGAGKPLWPQLGYWLLPLGVSAWLLTTAGAVAWEKAAWCDCEPRVVWMLWGLVASLAALGLIYPGMCLWRKATTGYFLASNERIRARLSRVGKPAMTWQPMVLAAIWTCIAISKTALMLRRGHSGGTDWFVVATFWFAAVTWLLLLARGQKPGRGVGNGPAGPGDSHGAGGGAAQGLGV